MAELRSLALRLAIGRRRRNWRRCFLRCGFVVDDRFVGTGNELSFGFLRLLFLSAPFIAIAHDGLLQRFELMLRPASSVLLNSCVVNASRLRLGSGNGEGDALSHHPLPPVFRKC